MATTPLESLQKRAAALAAPGLEAVDCASVPGGGSLPGLEIPSVGIRIPGDHRAALRAWDPPIVARVHDGATICDLRTVDPADDEILAKALAALPAP